MKYNQLNIQPHAKPKRVGHGIAAGQGKTAGRGTKGQGARAGGGKGPGFEGGQTPLMQRLPKLRGFTSKRAQTQVVNTTQIEAIKETVIDSVALVKAGLIEDAYGPIKLVSKDKLTKKKTVKLPAASASSVAMIQKAGGTFTKTAILKHAPKQKTQE